MTGNWSIFVM